MNHRSWKQISTTFKQIWGYDSFRYPQGEIIETILAKKDALIVMPTGLGKSICFQLPALLNNGLTLVISPLIALMENQVQDLQKRHLKADLLHSQLNREKRRSIFNAIAQQTLRLLYLAPETLLTPLVWEQLSAPEIKINGIMIDEAHCLVQWGDTFRPSYQRLGIVRENLLRNKIDNPKITVAAFTATANQIIQNSIVTSLKLEQPEVILVSPYRQNLHLKIAQVWTPKCRRDLMLKFIQSKGKQPGLIYVRSRNDSENLARFYQNLGYKADGYHSGLANQEKRELEGKWLEEERQFLIATSALGMGINKTNLRWLVHYQAPLMLSEYLQEIGRIGRDNQKASALTLFSLEWLNPEEKRQRELFFKQLLTFYYKGQNLLNNIPKTGDIETIIKEFPESQIALEILHSGNKLEWLDIFNYRIKSETKMPSFTNLFQLQKQLVQQMSQYLKTKQCRWQFLLTAFGFNPDMMLFRCGYCDNCLLNS